MPDYENKDGVYAITCWSSDSRHWVELVRSEEQVFDHLRIHDRESPDRYRDIALPATSTLKNTDKNIGDVVATPHVFCAVLTPDEEPFGSDTAEIEICETQLDPASAFHESHAHLPCKGRLLNLALSRDATHVAWLVKHTPTVRAQSLVERLLRFPPPEKRPIVELWVANCNGRDSHEVGHISVPDLDYDHEYTEEPYNINWVTGEKKISFTYHENLYTVPAID